MRIPLSEHCSQKVYRKSDVAENAAHVLEDELFDGLIKRKPVPFNKNVFPYFLTKDAIENCYELKADYYIGLEWLIEGEKYIHVEPKVNTKLLEIFTAGLDAEIENPEQSAEKTKEAEEKVQKSAGSGSAPSVNYLQMLLEVYTSPITPKDIGALVKIDWDSQAIKIEQKNDQLTPFLVVQFLRLLQSIVRKGLKKSYYKVQENLNNRVKGKILVGKHIKQNVFKNRMTNTWCEYQIFGEDHLENRFLKKVFSFCTSYIQNNTFLQEDIKHKTTHIINYCRPAFEHIGDEIKETWLRNMKPNPFFKEYTEAVHLGNYILRKFAYNISSTSADVIETPPFWIDMPRLFELYVYRKLLDANENDTGKILYQFGTYGNYLDLLIKNGADSIIVDAKYKLHYQNSHIHQDIRQVAGYARLKRVRKELKIDPNDDRNIACLIIYPTLSPETSDLSLAILKNKMEDPNGTYEIKAYHKLYKIGIPLPVIYPSNVNPLDENLKRSIMTENPLYTFTQFYKGETQPPADCPHPNLWYYEQMWAENEEERSDEHPRMKEYVTDVLPLFNEDDGIPNSLKALLYNRYTHWMGGYSLEHDVKNFREFLYGHYRPDLISRS